MVRAVLTGDTHVGFDLPARPRVQRRRRGHDFQANYERVVDHAIAAGVELLIHSGDVFHRSRPRPALVDDAFRPLYRAAAAGLEVVVLAGNHERGRLPRPLYAGHPRIHVVDEPQTVRLRLAGADVAIGAFPYVRHVRDAFRDQVAETGLLETPADLRVLVVHHCFEGARVKGHVFRGNHDVIRAADLPDGIAALLSGHIHRQQRLDHDLRGRPLAAPMLYAGSVERTSFAEMDEQKAFLELDFAPGRGGGRLTDDRSVPLPARPMRRATLSAPTAVAAWTAVGNYVDAAPSDAVISLRMEGPGATALTAEALRRLTPPTMNLDVRPA